MTATPARQGLGRWWWVVGLVVAALVVIVFALIWVIGRFLARRPD
jgi:hypothetical protein